MLLAENCLYPFRADVEVPYEPAGPKAERGTKMHANIEALCEGKPAPHSLGDDDEEACRRAAEWVLGFKHGYMTNSIMLEQPMAMSADGQARFLPREGHRAYSGVGSHELCGTADVVVFNFDAGELYVIDHKTGFSEWNHRPQLDTLAMMAARALGNSSATAVVLTARKTGPIPTKWPLDEIDIDAVAASAKHKLRLIQEGPEPNEGVWCRWCKAKSVCPAKKVAA